MLDQPETDNVPKGRLLAFTYADPTDDDCNSERLAELRQLARERDDVNFGPTIVDLRPFGRKDSALPVPRWLHGIRLSDGSDDSLLMPFSPYCNGYMAQMRSAIGERTPIAHPIDEADDAGPVDMNGIRVRVGDLIVTDCDEIGRVRDIAGNARRGGITLDLLFDGESMRPSEGGQGTSWFVDQLAVFLRADGSRPVVPVQPIDDTPPATEPTPDTSDDAKPDDEPDEPHEAPDAEETAADDATDERTPDEEDSPAQARDKSGRVLVPGDIALDVGNDIIVRVAVTYGADIIGDRLFDEGKPDEGTWSTAASEMVWLGRDTTDSKAVA